MTLNALPVYINDTGSCNDTGFSLARYLGTTAVACYSFDTDPTTQNAGETITCNDDSVLYYGKWGTPFSLTVGESNEDHPTFDFYLPTDEMAVAAHDLRTAADRVQVHFPDAIAPPNEPRVEFGPVAGGDEAQHPWITSGHGLLHLVWHQTDGGGEDTIEYAVCDFDATHDCTVPDDWSLEAPVADNSTGMNHHAKMAQLETDGKNQFVIYQYDDDATPGTRIRVAFASRCEGDATWTRELIRADPSPSTRDQSIFYGKPAIAVDRTHHLLHVAMVDADVYDNGADFKTATDSTVYWYTKPYTVCP